MTQDQMVLYHLQKIGNITPLEALSLYGCFRLSSRIFELKEQGYNIRTTVIHNGRKKYASYSLGQEPAKES